MCRMNPPTIRLCSMVNLPNGDSTLFDGTGVGLQDLAVAAVAVARARERGMGIEVGV